jgi:predicted ATPase/signal transduction histidine kinase
MSSMIPGYDFGERLHCSPLISVFRARRLSDGAEVVIKTLTPEYPARQDTAELRHEYAIIEKLRGAPGVLHVFDLLGYGYGNLAIVMEPFGQSLARFMEQRAHAPLPMDTFFDIAIRAAHALSTIHQRGIVHKDSVPRNILLDEASREVRFIDFGISSELSRERQDVNLAKRLEGSLPYLSPEQTGRMNRDLDYRSDYYSLGITFFELLTGRLPFHAKDTLEWIHSHISKRPPSPREINEAVPKAVAEVVLKLMAKNAEDRYQGAFGLIADLELCQAQWQQPDALKGFVPGTRDVSERFQVSQKLYGREQEIAELAAMFEQAAAGEVVLCLVSGHSGIGKTALVNEINKPIVRERGFMLQGKFDQLQRNTAYSALTHAIRGLMRQLMSESSERLNEWKTSLLAALGGNGQLLIDFVPELEAIIGPQPAVAPLGGTEAQNRFQMVFLGFLRVFASESHPLTIFLDDMQWSDAPTLAMLQRIFASRDLSHLLFICAYRSNEVDEGHPFRLAVQEIGKSRSVRDIELRTLGAESVCRLIAETLRTDDASAKPLAGLLFDRTEGNPFFVNEMLKTLHDERAITFATELGRWTWDIEKAATCGLSTNVVEFVVARLRRLEPSTQHLLELAACIGNTFDLGTLAVISERSPHEAGAALIKALQHNIIVPLDANYRYFAAADDSLNPLYKFQHDRIQQAAYALISEERKRSVHLTVGRLMLQHAGDQVPDERLIQIVSHLDEGRRLITDAEERLRLSQLNLKAGAKAHDSSAYDAALRYLETGLELLPEDSWQSNYALTKDLYTQYARCSYLTSRYDEAERCIDVLIARAVSTIEKADMLSMRTRQYATMGRMNESIEAAIQGLLTLGVEFTRTPGRQDIENETAEVAVNLAGRRIGQVVEAPALADEEKLVAIRLLMEIFPAAFLSGSGNLLPYLVLKSVNLALRYGNCPESAFAFATYGMVLCGVLNDPALGYEWGRLAIAISDRLDDLPSRARIIYVYAMFVHHWSNHWSTMTPWFKRGIEAGYQSGDLLYLAYSAQDCVIWDPKIDLATLCEQQRQYLTIVRDTEYQDSYDSGTLFLQLQLNLRGLTKERFSMNDDTFDEERCVGGMRERKFLTGIANYQIYKLEICFAYGDDEAGRELIAAQDRLIQSCMALPQWVRYNIISFLTLARLYPGLSTEDQADTMQRFDREITQMARWAANCEDNFLHLQRLMEAERARLLQQNAQAVAAYHHAIALAREHEFRRDEALANELTARFYLSISQERAAEGYMRAARLLYRTLGAERKARQLEEDYRQLLDQATGTRVGRDFSGQAARFAVESAVMPNDAIDMASVMKAARAISGEIEIEKLLQTVMDIVLENAGGQKGCFVTHRDGQLGIAAQTGEPMPALTQDPGQDQRLLPLSIINFVLRTGETILLDDASQNARFESDPYIRDTRPKSVICVPIVRHPVFEGAIYMENNLVTGAFSAERLEVINLLAAQASISIENAQLYASLESKVRERTRALAGALDDLKHTQTQLVHSEKMAGLGTLVAGVAHEINNPTNFVSLGAASLEEDLLEFKSVLFGMIGDDNDPEITQHFRDKFNRLHAALANINEGTSRISTIVRDLRTFSRLDEAERKVVPLAENLESTIRLVRSQYQDGVEFVTRFIDNPEIECLPAQLNQVFMNIVVNACQAVLAKNFAAGDSAKRGTVTITTERDDDYIAIRFTDDGVGMTEEVKQRIFEPFFTTKPVGEGTGMGMSIVYQIIEKHHGKVKVESTEGRGSTIIVLLPV